MKRCQCKVCCRFFALLYGHMFISRAKESIHLAQPPELPTVTEDEETVEITPAPVTPSFVAEKDEQGNTQLHTLVRFNLYSYVRTISRLRFTQTSTWGKVQLNAKCLIYTGLSRRIVNF